MEAKRMRRNGVGELVAKCDRFGTLKHSSQPPYAFTEHGAVMLASVLNSEKAIEVNVQIVRIFTRMREMLLTNKEILLKLEQLEKQVGKNSEDIKMIFAVLKELVNPPREPRVRIGFRRKSEKD